MNDFSTELRELIDKWLDHPGVTEDEIMNALLDAEERLREDDDD